MTTLKGYVCGASRFSVIYSPARSSFGDHDMKTPWIGRREMVAALVAFSLMAVGQTLLCGAANLGAADEQSELRQKALSLNDITGDDPIEAQVKELVADPDGTKKLL